jgi:hypothetical protein
MKNSLYGFNRMVFPKAVLNYWMMLQMKNMKEFGIDRSFGNIG